MAKSLRITIMIDERLVVKLHEIQARKIRSTKKSFSLSKIVNITLAKQLRIKLNGH